MRKRPLGRLGYEVSELSLGTWGLSGEAYGAVDAAERFRAVDRALELGVTLFETADVYARGGLEACLGERLVHAPSRVYVVTKIGTFRPSLRDRPADAPPPITYKRFEPEHLRQAVEESFLRMRRKADVVLLHNPSAATLFRGEATGAMKELKAAGTIGGWGVSAGDAAAARAAIAEGAEVVELAYNVFFSRELHELVGEITASKTGLLARSVLAHGLLAGQLTPGRFFGPGDHRADRWTQAELRTRVRQLDAVRPLVAGDVLTMRAAAVRFALANEAVSSVVLGPKSVTQLEQLVREAGTEPPYLSTEALTRLAADLARAGVIT